MLRILTAFLLALFLPAGAGAQSSCPAPSAVCDSAERVYAIASFDPLASAVLIEPGLLVTNRHAVADNARAQVFRPDGSQFLADVVPSAYDGDLILLRAPSLSAADTWTTADAVSGGDLYTIGADVGRGRIRVYKPGRQVLAPAKGKPLARLHHSAPSQPGNSGGALVDGKGRLVAIVTSGGEGRQEAIPASEISRLKSLSGPQHLIESNRIGLAYKRCTEAVDAANATRQRLEDKHAAFLVRQCRASNNRQLMDLAGQVLGRQRRTDAALELFDASLDQDPNAINTRLSLAITLHLAQRYEDEIPHIKQLLDILPRDIQVLRFAIQAGAWGGDRQLAERGLELMERHHPKLAPVAKRFMDRPPPPRRGVPPG